VEAEFITLLDNLDVVRRMLTLCLGTIIIGYRLASWLGKEFRVKSVGEVAAMEARENYMKSRRNPRTANQQEIVKKIKELFSHDLDLDPSVLNREAPLF